MWRTITNFLVGTLSHVRVGDAHSHSWVDTGIEQRGCGHPSLLSRCPACITRQVSGSSASYMQMTWSFLRTRRICRLGSTQLPIGVVSGDSLLASALTSPLRRDKCPLAQSCWKASISQWYALTGTPASILTPSLRWTDHVNHLTARGFGLFAQTTTWSRSEDLPVSFGSLLL